MKPRKPKPERWYKTPPVESPEGNDNPTSKLSDYINASATIGLGGNSVEERLGNIQVLLKKISRDLSFIALVILVSLVLGLIGIFGSA
jgi:hypothetical protein